MKSFIFSIFKSQIIILMIATFITWVFMVPDIDKNSMQEYCTPTASLVYEPSEDVYVKSWGGYRLYNPKTDKNARKFYKPRIDSPYSINESNWSSQSRPCVLNDNAIAETKGIFLLFYLVLSIPTILIIFLIQVFKKKVEE